MRKRSGFLLSIEGGWKAMAIDSEQRKEFVDMDKVFIHYMNDDFEPIIENGKEKTGLKTRSKLQIIGYFDF